MKALEGKIALVLGGSRGIGAAIVEKLSAAGAKVTFSYNSSPKPAQELAAKTGSKEAQVDSGDQDAVRSFIAGLGPLDILVVNSGVAVLGNPLETSAAEVDKMFDVNVRSAYHASIEAARKMNDEGRIILIGSTNGDRMPFAGGAAYALTKSALQGFVRGLARDLGERRITVNNVQPGPVDTDMNPANGPMAEMMHSFMALKRHGKPDEIADFVTFLAGPQAAYITGAQLTIDGGFGA